jgi:transcriptional regulator with XRE-family HTH domain
MKNYTKAKRRIEVSPGESVRILRELQELSQNELSELKSIPQSTISTIEPDRINLGEHYFVTLRYWFFRAGMSQWKQLHNMRYQNQ